MWFASTADNVFPTVRRESQPRNSEILYLLVVRKCLGDVFSTIYCSFNQFFLFYMKSAADDNEYIRFLSIQFNGFNFSVAIIQVKDVQL